MNQEDDQEERVIFSALERAEIDADTPFLKKTAQFNALAGRMAGFRQKYEIDDADWNLLAGDWIDFVLMVQDPSKRVDN